MNEIIENLYVGEAAEGYLLNDIRFTIIDVRDKNLERNVNAIWIPILVTKNNDNHYLMASMKALNNVAKLIHKNLKSGKKVLVHCSAGMERSPLSIAWYIHKYKHIPLTSAYNIVKTRHPITMFKYGWLSRREVLK